MHKLEEIEIKILMSEMHCLQCEAHATSNCHNEDNGRSKP